MYMSSPSWHAGRSLLIPRSAKDSSSRKIPRPARFCGRPKVATQPAPLSWPPAIISSSSLPSRSSSSRPSIRRPSTSTPLHRRRKLDLRSADHPAGPRDRARRVEPDGLDPRVKAVGCAAALVSSGGFVPRTPLHARSRGPRCPAPLAWLTRFARRADDRGRRPHASEEKRAASIRVLRVLFIGNSLTAVNGLPRMVEALSRAKGAATVDATAITTNNFSLEDHWNQGPARATLAKGGWSVVVPPARAVVAARITRAAPRLRKAVRRRRRPCRRAHRFVHGLALEGARSRLRRRQRVVHAGGAGRRGHVATSRRRMAGGVATRSLADTLRRRRVSPERAGLVPSRRSTIWRGLSAQSAIGLPGPRGVPAATLKLLQEVADHTIVTPSR